MVFNYQPSDPEGRLSQGEILSDLQELEPQHPGRQISPGNPSTEFTLVEHPKIVILTPDCDLLTDFLARRGFPSIDEAKLLHHVQCCDIYEEREIRQHRKLSTDLWKRVRQNQDERYHCIPPGQIQVETEIQQPALFLDFKKMFSISTEFLYKSIEAGGVKRQGVVPPIWLHSLIHRYFAFHSRIGVPDPEDKRR